MEEIGPGKAYSEKYKKQVLERLLIEFPAARKLYNHPAPAQLDHASQNDRAHNQPDVEHDHAAKMPERSEPLTAIRPGIRLKGTFCSIYLRYPSKYILE